MVLSVLAEAQVSQQIWAPCQHTACQRRNGLQHRQHLLPKPDLVCMRCLHAISWAGSLCYVSSDQHVLVRKAKPRSKPAVHAQLRPS